MKQNRFKRIKVIEFRQDLLEAIQTPKTMKELAKIMNGHSADKIRNGLEALLGEKVAEMISDGKETDRNKKLYYKATQSTYRVDELKRLETNEGTIEIVPTERDKVFSFAMLGHVRN